MARLADLIAYSGSERQKHWGQREPARSVRRTDLYLRLLLQPLDRRRIVVSHARRESLQR